MGYTKEETGNLFTYLAVHPDPVILTPSPMGRHYLGFQAAWEIPDRLILEGGYLANLTDESFLINAGLTLPVTGDMELALNGIVTEGPDSSEFGSIGRDFIITAGGVLNF